MTEELKAKARRIWEEIFPSGDVERLAEVIAEDSIDHGARPDEPQGLAGEALAQGDLSTLSHHFDFHAVGEGTGVPFHAIMLSCQHAFLQTGGCHKYTEKHGSVC